MKFTLSRLSCPPGLERVVGNIVFGWVMSVGKTLDFAFMGFDFGECAHVLCCYFFHSCRIGNYGNRERGDETHLIGLVGK